MKDLTLVLQRSGPWAPLPGAVDTQGRVCAKQEGDAETCGGGRQPRPLGTPNRRGEEQSGRRFGLTSHRSPWIELPALPFH